MRATSVRFYNTAKGWARIRFGQGSAVLAAVVTDFAAIHLRSVESVGRKPAGSSHVVAVGFSRGLGAVEQIVIPWGVSPSTTPPWP